MSVPAEHCTIYRSDYKAPAFTTETVDLRFELNPEATIVTSKAVFSRLRHGQREKDLWLDGNELEMVSAAVNGDPLAPSAYEISSQGLRIFGVPDHFDLEIITKIAPAKNTQLSGLYISNGTYCTQCEAEGFRRITFFQDRPDVMSRYRVRIEADKVSCPLLLSNGNPISFGELPNGSHYAIWEDPFPKPSYLFALVAGDLALLEDNFRTKRGRTIALRIYSEYENIGQCGHAMESLKKAMRWDEENFGLEYDLDLYQIVAVSDFNMGAMENKGLNVFNTSATLSKQDTATDQDFMNVERIIAHEYFHNWTGNRVTCRDWFQLTLKEGLTVFRDQLFSADMHSPGVKRVGDVALLREGQFAEDASPLAHAIRPDSYLEINNFYTRTVYDKGAEVIRMIHTLVGARNFRKGMDLYFARHDGQAVTCDDFVDAMEGGSGIDLGHFRKWYGQAGTPVLTVSKQYDADSRIYRMTFRQTTPPTPGQAHKEALQIPIRLGLLSRGGDTIPLQLQGEIERGTHERLIQLSSEQDTFTFVNVDTEPVPSLLRGFSAPVRLEIELDDTELEILFSYDTDEFSRWDAGQQLASRIVLTSIRTSGDIAIDGHPLSNAMRTILSQEISDPAFWARLINLPTKGYLFQQMAEIDVEGVDLAIRGLRSQLGRQLQQDWERIYLRYQDNDDFEISKRAIGRRALKNTALQYLLWADSSYYGKWADKQYRLADNMTDRIGALTALTRSFASATEEVLSDFYETFKFEPLVVNKWFAIQAMIEDDSAVSRVQRLRGHPAFTMTNPNRMRALFGAFVMGNSIGFHRPDGAGYRLLADTVLEVDARNPQLASRLLTSLGRWRKYDANRQSLMKSELERILARTGLSRDSYEIAQKCLSG